MEENKKLEMITADDLLNGQNKSWESIIWKNNVSYSELSNLAEKVVSSCIQDTDHGETINRYSLMVLKPVILLSALSENYTVNSENLEKEYQAFKKYEYDWTWNINDVEFYGNCIDILVDRFEKNNTLENFTKKKVSETLNKLNSILDKIGETIDRVDPNILIKYGQPLLNRLIDKLPDLSTEEAVNKFYKTIKH